MASPLGLPPVRILRPTLWTAAAVGTIYLGCALFEVRHDAVLARRLHEQAARQRRFGLRTATAGPPPPALQLRDLDAVRALLASTGGHSPLATGPAAATPAKEGVGGTVAAALAGLSEPAVLMGGVVAANAGVFVLERLLPGLSPLFSHMPAAAVASTSVPNFTLLTSVFGHVGPVHLALNMYGVVQFLPPVALSPTFQASGSHLAAFYLSAGVLAAYGFHLASAWPRPQDRLVGTRGASGAVMAVVGAFGASFPDRPLGIVLLPGSQPASHFLAAVALFEAYGLFVGFPRLRLAHAAHLTGLAVGAAYVYGDGRARVWLPARRWAFRQLRRLDMV